MSDPATTDPLTRAVEALASWLRAELVNPESGRSGDVTVYAAPRETLSMSDVPCAVCMVQQNTDHTWRHEAYGYGRLDFAFTVYVIVGQRTTNINELHARALPWYKRLADALMKHLALAEEGRAVVEFLGAKDSDTLVTIRQGLIRWDKQWFYGLTLNLPATIKLVQEMDA